MSDDTPTNASTFSALSEITKHPIVIFTTDDSVLTQGDRTALESKEFTRMPTGLSSRDRWVAYRSFDGTEKSLAEGIKGILSNFPKKTSLSDKELTKAYLWITVPLPNDPTFSQTSFGVRNADQCAKQIAEEWTQDRNDFVAEEFDERGQLNFTIHCFEKGDEEGLKKLLTP